MLTTPVEWKEFSLGDLTQDIITGGTPSTDHPEYYDGEIPWLTSTEIHQKYVDTPTRYITRLGLLNSSAAIAPKNSVLIALAGQGKTRGKVAYLKKNMAVNQSLAALVVNDLCTSDFLYYLLSSKYKSLREISSGDGARGGLNRSLLQSFRVKMPTNKDEQKAIARALKSMDDYADDIELLMEKKKGIRDGAQEELMSGEKRLRGFADSSEARNEWEWNSLRECVSEPLSYGINAPAAPYRLGCPRYLRITDITDDGRYSLVDQKSVIAKDSENYMLKEGDIVLARTGASISICGILDQGIH